MNQCLETYLKDSPLPLSTKEIQAAFIRQGQNPPSQDSLRRALNKLASRGEVVLLRKQGERFFPRPKEALPGAKFFVAWSGTSAAGVTLDQENIEVPRAENSSVTGRDASVGEGPTPDIAHAEISTARPHTQCPEEVLAIARTATREHPLHDLAVRAMLLRATGRVLAPATIRKYFQVLIDQGLVRAFIYGSNGQLIPYRRTGNSKLYIVWAEHDDGVSQLLNNLSRPDVSGQGPLSGNPVGRASLPGVEEAAKPSGEKGSGVLPEKPTFTPRIAASAEPLPTSIAELLKEFPALCRNSETGDDGGLAPMAMPPLIMTKPASPIDDPAHLGPGIASQVGRSVTPDADPTGETIADRATIEAAGAEAPAESDMLIMPEALVAWMRRHGLRKFILQVEF